MQALKRRRVRRVHGRLPAHAAYVPLDFETGRLHEALGQGDFDAWAPAFFSWLETTSYLTRPAIRETLDSIAAAAAPEPLQPRLLARPHVVPADHRPVREGPALIAPAPSEGELIARQSEPCDDAGRRTPP